MKKIYISMAILLILLLALVLKLNVFDTRDFYSEDDGDIHIVTSIYPLYLLAQNIIDGAENINLENMTNGQVGCLHDYQLTTDNMVALRKSDIFIINGLGMENFLSEVSDTYPNLNILDTSKNTSVIDNNSHIWLDIDNYKEQAINIKNALLKIDPNNSEIYEINTKNYINKLNVLKNNMISSLTNLKGKNVVVFHESFEYLAKYLGFNVVAVIETDEETEPSANRLSELVKIIEDNNVEVILTEPQYSDEIAKTLANETNCKVYEIESIATGSLDDKDKYINAMESNILVLKEALTN